MTRIFMILAVTVVLAGCVGGHMQTTPQMVDAAVTTQQVKLTAVQGVALECQQGLMSQKDCATAQQAYLAWQLVNSLKWQTMLTGCQDEVLGKRILDIMGQEYPVLSFGKAAIQ